MAEYAELNISKCKAFIAGGTYIERLLAKYLREIVFAEISQVPKNHLCLLGTPLTFLPQSISQVTIYRPHLFAQS